MSENNMLVLDELKTRIDNIVRSGALDEKSTEKLVERWVGLVRNLAKAKDPQKYEPKIASLVAHVVFLETPPSLQKTKELRAKKASDIMTKLSLGVCAALIISNWLSIIFLQGPNATWPKGWFISDFYLGFALAGVSINILLRLRTRVQRGDWDDKFWGTHASRVLQAVVYASLIYWFVGELPPDAKANIPFASAGLLIGLFVHLVEEALVGVGERFVDMISALFSTQFGGPKQKEARNQELRKELDVLRGQYIEATIADEMKKQSIKQLFEDALTLLQSNENEQSEHKLQELALEMKNTT